VPQANLAKLARKVSLAAKETTANLALLVPLARPAHLDHLALQAKLAKRAHLAPMPNLEPKDHQVHPVPKEHQEHQALLETKALLPKMVHLAQPDHQVHLAQAASLETKDQLDLPVCPAHLVWMPTIVLAHVARPRMPRRRPRKPKRKWRLVNKQQWKTLSCMASLDSIFQYNKAVLGFFIFNSALLLSTQSHLPLGYQE